MLQLRLAGRGVQLAALLAALSVVESSAKAAVPATLARATIRFALLAAAGEPAAQAIPAHVAALAAGVTRAMLLSKAKIAVILLLTGGLFLAGAGGVTRQLPATGQPPAQSAQTGARRPALPPAPTNEAAQSPDAADKDTITCAGRVLGPDGKPVAGARLYAKGGYKKGQEFSREEPSPLGTSGPDGRFKFAIPRVKPLNEATSVTAMAANYGAGWVEIPADGNADDLTLRLVKDDVPITGQIVDLEGKPVAGATLLLRQIDAAPGEDLIPWLEAVKAKEGLNLALPFPYQQLELRYLSRYTDAVSGKVTTDAEGRFRLTGIGRNRLARVQLDSPTIASQYLRILTRPGATVEAVWGGDGESGIPRQVWAYYGASFRHAAAPARPIVGVVRDRDTKQPLAGVTIRSLNGLGSGTNVHTTTDAQGRYRLSGIPKGEDERVVAIPPNDLPYVASTAGVPDTKGLGPVTVDIGLKRGVWIEGKVTDKVTGKPVRAQVEYFALSTNPNLREYAGFDAARPDQDEGNEDGSYRVVGLPGPGLVAVRHKGDSYLRANERDDGYGKESPDDFLGTEPLGLVPKNYSAVAPVKPAAVRAVKRDLTLDPGRTFTGTVLGPDGRPLAGSRSFGLINPRWEREASKTAEFTVHAFNPRRPREVFFQHPETGLVGIMPSPKENGGTVTVRLGPGAAVTGRLVDSDGRPRAGVELRLILHTKKLGQVPGSSQRVQTDREGRFRIAALLPTYEYQLAVLDARLPLGEGLGSGKTKDLGAVQIRSEPPNE
jgi:hypothetical protein